MNIFAAVVPADPGQLSTYSAALEQVRRDTIPFADQPHEEAVWTNGHILAASFSIHATHVPIHDYVASNDARFMTFNGIPLFGQPAQSEQSWAQLLLARHEAGRLEPETFGGYYNLLAVDGDTVTAFTCLSRVEPIYWTQTAECIAIGNRASLVWALANRSTRFVYEPCALTTVCLAGWQVHDLVPYRGVQLLANGTQARVRRGDVHLTAYKPYEYREPSAIEPADQEAAAGRLSAALMDGVRVFGGFRDELTVNLSGGKDSRIMVALCRAAGVPFRCVTSGQPADREVIVAKEIAQLLGVEHEVTPVRASGEIPEVDVFALLRQHVVQGDGMTSVYDPTYPIRLKPNILLSGHGGECYRGGYDMQREGSRPVVKDRQMALRFLHDLNLCNNLAFLLPHAMEAQQQVNQTTADEFVQRGFPWEHFYDYALTKLREGRGVSNLRQAAAYGAFAFSPFLNDGALAIGWEFPLSLRKSEMLYYRILCRLHPELARMRFSDSRWKFEQKKPGPETSRKEWRQRAPLPPTPRTQAAHSWRLAYDGKLRDTVRDYLLQSRNSRIFEVVDYDKLETVLRSPPPTTTGILRSVYGILTAAYFLNDDWRPGPK